jgi:hypothetical protein
MSLPARTAANVRRVRAYYLPLVPILRELIEQDLPQNEICRILNEQGKTTFNRTPWKQSTLSRVIKSMRQNQLLPPDPYAVPHEQPCNL